MLIVNPIKSGSNANYVRRPRW